MKGAIDDGQDDDELDDTIGCIDPPGPFASMKSLRRFVKDNEGSRNRQMRDAVRDVLADIVRREGDPELDKTIEDAWEKKRVAALPKVPRIDSDDDARKVAEALVAEHGGKAIDVAARERDALFFDLGEDEAAAIWQRVVDAILRIRAFDDPSFRGAAH